MQEFYPTSGRTPPHMTDNYFPATDASVDTFLTYGNTVNRRTRPLLTPQQRRAMAYNLVGISTAALLFAALFDPRKERARRARQYLQTAAPAVASVVNSSFVL